jgi:hypothetical protein
MNGETNVEKLLTGMEPVLQEGEFIFATLAPAAFEQLDLCPLGWFREAEGITVIVEKEAARSAGLEGRFVARLITLNVHSSLEAVGFLAQISARLAAAGISVNVVSAFYHDHLFVPAEKAGQALQVLEALAAGG